jgi:hypothetical protein
MDIITLKSFSTVICGTRFALVWNKDKGRNLREISTLVKREVMLQKEREYGSKNVEKELLNILR